jgi:hypothetical protein
MRNRIGVFVASLVLLRCAWDSVPRMQLTWHVWSRLRHAHRPAPDTSRDNEYASLKRFIPPDSVVGLVQAARSGTPEREREYYFLQYALAPTLIEPSTEPILVLVCPSSAAASLIDPAQYARVTLGDEVGLYRRLAR